MEEQLSEMKPNYGSTRKPALRALPVGLLAAAAVLTLALAACGGGGDGGAGLSGEIVGDGSSTVFPISEAVAEAFREVEGGVDVVVGLSGTGGGFEKFCAGETDFNDASRPIKDEEKQACAGNGIEWVEFQGAAGDKGSLGYFGFAYYEQNTDKLKLLGVDGGSGCIQPTSQTILDGTYSPLSRPLFVYGRKD